MKSAPIPANEAERLRLLRKLNILDTLEEQAYDDLTFLAAQICGVPIALVSLVDQDRQWFKSHYGLDARETPRELAFCAHAILSDEIFIIEDSDKDERFFDNPLAKGEPHVRFYAGAPLTLDNDIRLGTLCVIDNRPHSLSSDQKQALQALARQVSSQLELRLKLQELRKLDQAKDEFIYMVNHELRTPLTAIKGSLGLLKHNLQSETASAQTRELSALAARNTDRLLNIVNDILDVAKLEAGKLKLNLAPLDIVELTQRAVELNEPFCTRCVVEIHWQVEDGHEQIWVKGDEQRLLQVLTNLISNAAKFTHEGDTVEIAITKNSDQVMVSVTDHGPGISEEDQAMLFSRFEQLHNKGDGKQPGTGLGLNISKHIVELHHGAIGFEVVPAKSTTFYFSLPLSKSGSAPAAAGK